MRQSNIHLDFQCPKKWNTMRPRNNGRFCSDCKKVVTDFSKISTEELSQTIVANLEEESCGSFSAFQLNRPFNNWKDKYISCYQKNKFDKSEFKLTRQITLFLLMIILIATGCTRRQTGKFAPAKSCKKKHKHDTTQTLEDKKQ